MAIRRQKKPEGSVYPFPSSRYFTISENERVVALVSGDRRVAKGRESCDTAQRDLNLESYQTWTPVGSKRNSA